MDKGEENSCGNSAADPFDTLVGSQQESFIDFPSLGGLSVSRTYVSYTAPGGDLTRRPTWPELHPYYISMGPGWFWEYGLFLATKGSKFPPLIQLHDKNGLVYYYHLEEDGIWWSERANGHIEKLPDGKVLLVRSNGERIVFQGRSSGYDYYWRPISIEQPSSNLTVEIQYPGRPTQNTQQYLQAITVSSNKGTRLEVEWHPIVTTAYYSRRYTWNYGFNWFLGLSRIRVVSAYGPEHDIEYQYQSFPAGGSQIFTLKDVLVDGQTRWSYENYKPLSYTTTFVKKIRNGRGDTTELFWGPNSAVVGDAYRGSRVTGSDGEVYSDIRISWSLDGTAVLTKIQTLYDRVSSALKNQVQRHDYVSYGRRGTELRRPVAVSGPGCASCGLMSDESYTYDPHSAETKTKCDADGVETVYTYDALDNVSSVSQQYGSPTCQLAPYIIAEAVTSTSVSAYSSALQPGTPTSQYSPSVLSDAFTAGTITDFVDGLTGAPTDKPSASIQFGATRRIGGEVVYEEHRTQYQWGAFEDSLDGPRTDVHDVRRTIYYPGTKQVHYVDQFVDGEHYLRTIYEAYDDFGNPTRIISPAGLITEYVYGNWNKPTRVTLKAATESGEDIITEYSYDAAGDLDRIRLPEGNVVDYDYAGPGLLKRIRRLNGTSGSVIDEVRYQYDPEGNRSVEEHYRYDAVTPAIVYSQKTTYDLYNHVAEITNALGQSRQTRYSKTGLLLESVDERNQSTTYWYDGLKRLYEVRAPDGGVTRYGYDTRGNLVRVLGCKNLDCTSSVESTYLYDDFGRLVLSSSPDGGQTEYEYDEAGNLKRKVDGRGVITDYTYDAANRLLGVFNFVDPGVFTELVYDEFDGAVNAGGRLAAAKTGSGTVVYQYDLAGRVIHETRFQTAVQVDRPFERRFDTHWLFDKNGNLRVLTYPSGITVAYLPSPTDLDRVRAVVATTADGTTVPLVLDASYDPGNILKFAEFGNGTVATWERDAARRISNIDVAKGATGITSKSYSYDAGNNISQITDRLTPANSQDFDYDPANRLAAAAGAYGTLSYQYDLAGNRVFSYANGTPTAYGYASNDNRLFIQAHLDPGYTTSALISGATTQSMVSMVSSESAANNRQADSKLSANAKSILVRITNDLTDFFFSGRRYLQQTYGVGSFSNGKSSAQGPEPVSAATRLYERKIEDTVTLLKESLDAGSITLADVKAYVVEDAALSTQIDALFVDLETLEPEQLLPWVITVANIMSPEDLMLLAEVLDLAGRVEIANEPQIRLSTAGSVLTLSNQPGEVDVREEWKGILHGVHLLVQAARLSPGAAKENQGEVARLIADTQRKVGRLRATGVPPSRALRAMAADEHLSALVLRATADRLALAPRSIGSMSLSISPPPGVIIDALYAYDGAGNLVRWETPSQTRTYTYGPDNRLRAAEQAAFGFDYLGRRNYKSTPALFENQITTLHEFFGYGSGGELLSWTRQNLFSVDVGRETTEDYVYLAGERIAKLVTERALAVMPDPGSGGGGCCCATTAVAYDGKPFCDLAAYHALQVFRGFRNTVLSGNTLGEALIRFYYRDLSPVAVAVFREYPELRHAMNYVLRGSAWLLEFWVAPAVAADLPTLPSTVTVYWYHNDHLGTPLALSDASGNVVAEWVRDPFGNVVSKSGAVDDKNLFPGQFMDSTSGLVYNWNPHWVSVVGSRVSGGQR